MRFSFILPAYKRIYIKEAIDSILLQKYTDFELIIVDDCSPDHLDEIVGTYDDNRIAYYKNPENIGGKDLVAQWNKCLEYANGDYVILATDDDLYEPDFLSTFVELILQYPNANLFRARILNVDSSNCILWTDYCYKTYLSPIEFRYHYFHGMHSGIPQYIFKRKVLICKGGFVNFPLAWGADDATALMMSDCGVINSQKHLVRFCRSDVNISSEKSQTGLIKLEARLLFGKWLYSNPIVNTERDEKWNCFYQNQVVDYTTIYIKRLLIMQISELSLFKKIIAYDLVRKSRLLSLKNELSVIFHSLTKI